MNPAHTVTVHKPIPDFNTILSSVFKISQMTSSVQVYGIFFTFPICLMWTNRAYPAHLILLHLNMVLISDECKLRNFLRFLYFYLQVSNIPHSPLFSYTFIAIQYEYSLIYMHNWVQQASSWIDIMLKMILCS